MKPIITFLLLLISLSGYTQNNYFSGYQDGFKYSCKCIDLPPKNLTLHNGTYDQGYLDGKIDGILYNKRNSSNSSNNNNQQNYIKQDFNQTSYSPNYELLERSLYARQTAYNNNRERVDNYVQALKSTIQVIRDNKSNSAVNNHIAALFLLENSFYKDLNKVYLANLDYSLNSSLNYAISTFEKHAQALTQLISDIKTENELSTTRITQVLNLYNSFENKNISVKNGWHLVYATNRKDFCDIRRVYVINNKIKKFVREGEIYKEWDSLNIDLSTDIVNCKSTIKLKSSELFNEIYFINVLADPNNVTSAPLTTGKISFWTNYNKEKIHIYVENQYVGTLDSFFQNEEPLCAQVGTVVFINQPGTYKYVAVSDNYRWEGTINVSNNGCAKKKLIL